MKSNNILIVLKSFLTISIIFITIELSYSQSARRKQVSDEELARINAELRIKSEQMDKDYESGEIMGPRGATAHDDWGDSDENNVSTSNSEEEIVKEETENDPSQGIIDNNTEEPPYIYPEDPNNIESENLENMNSIKDESLKQIVCASAKPSITSGSVFKRAKFTIGGSEPQEIKITSSAENFAIKKEYGGVVYQMIDGKSWGSTILEPGSYILSCNGGGAMGLMSATVCIKNPMAGQVQSPGDLPVVPADDYITTPEFENEENQPVEIIKPSLPRGPVEKIIIRAQGSTDTELYIKKSEKKSIVIAWGLDAAGHKIGDLIADEWKISEQSDKSIGSINTKTGEFKAGLKEGKVNVIASIKNKDDKVITGAFSIIVSEEPPITFKGKVILYDENNIILKNLGGVLVHGYVSFWKNIDTFNKPYHYDKEYPIRTRTKSDGKFKFMVPAKNAGFSLIGGWDIETKAPANKLKPGYTWSSFDPVIAEKRNNSVNPGPFSKLVSKGVNVIRIGPWGGVGSNAGSLTHWMEKADFVIDGIVVHRGKRVIDIKVSLVDARGNTLGHVYSDTKGYYKLYVDGEIDGRCWLKVKGWPDDLNDVNKTVHNLLYMKENKSIDLPLQAQKETIDIELITFGDKIGYTGP